MVNSAAKAPAMCAGDVGDRAYRAVSRKWQGNVDGADPGMIAGRSAGHARDRNRCGDGDHTGRRTHF